MSKLIDLTGQNFGYWHVIERAENDKNGRTMWLCKCTKCNKTIKPVSGSHLRGGRSKACTKCRQRKIVNSTIKDETGKDYGFLHVERRATEEEKPRKDKVGVFWNCTCKRCGRKNVIVFGDYLRNGDTKSCGCIQSYNESKICQMLDNISQKYKTQQTFENLTSTGRNCDKLMFDIGVYEQNELLYIIEYDGIQHFESGHFNDTYEKTHRNDLLKNKYCFENNIPLIRIPYKCEDYSLKDLQPDTTQFLLTSENEKDYYKKYSGV